MFDHLTIPVLKKIAAYKDEVANLHLQQHKTYSKFDEPSSVQAARQCLASIEAMMPHLIDNDREKVMKRLDYIEQQCKYAAELPALFHTYIKELIGHIRARPDNMVPKTSLDLADLENSNLRKLLFRCAQFMTEERRQEIAKSLRAPIEKGGVVEDSTDDLGKEVTDALKLLKKFADHFDKISDENTPWGWHVVASNLCSQAREYENLIPEPKTIHQAYKE